MYYMQYAEKSFVERMVSIEATKWWSGEYVATIGEIHSTRLETSYSNWTMRYKYTQWIE